MDSRAFETKQLYRITRKIDARSCLFVVEQSMPSVRLILGGLISAVVVVPMSETRASFVCCAHQN